MTIDFGTITEGELDAVANAVRVLSVDEDAGRGVVLRCLDGKRTWDVGTDEAWVRVTGDAQDFDGVYVLPTRVITGAAEFAENGGGCNLTIRDRVAVVTSTGGSSFEIGLVSKDPVLRPSTSKNPVRVSVSMRELQRAMSVATEIPEVDDMSTIFSKPPTCHFEISKGLLSISRDWSYANCANTVVNIPGTTVGKGRFHSRCFTLAFFLARHVVGDSEVTLSFDPEAGQFLQASFDSTSMFVERHPEGAAQFHPQLVSWLKDNDHRYAEETSSGTFAIDYKGTPMRVQLLDGVESVLRSTITILHGVRETAKLLRELNRLNTTRCGIRIWHDNNMVVVGRDDRCENSPNLKVIFDSLVREANDLDGLLGPMFGGDSSPRAA